MDSNEMGLGTAEEFAEESVGQFEAIGQAEMQAVPQRAIGRAGSRLLSFFGLVLLGIGGALAAAPLFSWQSLQIVQFLTTLGIQSGVVALGGLVLIGSGTVGRSIARLAERPRLTDTGMVHAVECMADQVSTLAASLSHLHDRVTSLGLRDPIIQVDAPAPDADLVRLYREQKDATFQLAAGLDKLGRQVGDRLGVKLGAVEQSFDDLREGVEVLANQVPLAIERHLATMISALAPERQQPTTAPVSETRSEPVYVQEITADESLATEIKLEDPHPELVTEVSPLAFLEGLKSIDPPSRDPSAPSVSAPPLDFDILDEGNSKVRVDEPPAALPGTIQHNNERAPN